MLNKLCGFVKKYDMLHPGDHVVCGVSGGADSIALLFAMWLLRDKLGICVSAAHFNHCLRGEESDRDEAFVRQFCARYEIALEVCAQQVVAGKKGLEAAARDARYAFLKTLPGKIATAHTANDNAETVLMHLVRGTGLKGLGGIAPVNGNLIRPMLGVTRQDVMDFLCEYHLAYVTDSSNETDAFLRNRLRHHVMPVLQQENPRLAENVSAMALRLREDEQALTDMAYAEPLPDISTLRKMPRALRSRTLSRFLEQCGVKEPEAEHIALAEDLIFSDKPSASASFPGGVTVARCYQRLERQVEAVAFAEQVLPCPGVVEISELGLRVVCTLAQSLSDQPNCFTVVPNGTMVLRTRLPGDKIRLAGGTKSLKKLFIDKKIPAQNRGEIPVIADDEGVIAVHGFGASKDRLADDLPAVQICFENV